MNELTDNEYEEINALFKKFLGWYIVEVRLMDGDGDYWCPPKADQKKFAAYYGRWPKIATLIKSLKSEKGKL